MQRWTGTPYGNGMDIFSDGTLNVRTSVNGRSELIAFDASSGKALSTMAVYNYLGCRHCTDNSLPPVQ